MVFRQSEVERMRRWRELQGCQRRSRLPRVSVRNSPRIRSGKINWISNPKSVKYYLESGQAKSFKYYLESGQEKVEIISKSKSIKYYFESGQAKVEIISNSKLKVKSILQPKNPNLT
jgi:hypothetical protein